MKPRMDLSAPIPEAYRQVALAELGWTVVAINAWNRVASSSRSVPGDHRPAAPAS